MGKPIPIELKELMKKIVEVFSNPEDLVSLLNGIPADQRAILCLTTFPEFPTDLASTPLTGFIREANRMGLEPLRALLKRLSPEQRLVACQFISNEEGSTAFTETFYNQLINTELVKILIVDMSDQQIDTLMQQSGFVTGHPAINAQTYLAMRKGFEMEPFKSYALRQKLDKKALIVSAWKNPLVMDDINLGFKTFFKSQKIRPSDFTEEERKGYFLGPQHYLYYALLESSLVSENLIENLEAWLDGFTLEQKRDALNPGGLAPETENQLMIKAYNQGKKGFLNYLVTLGIPYPKSLPALVNIPDEERAKPQITLEEPIKQNAKIVNRILGKLKEAKISEEGLSFLLYLKKEDLEEVDKVVADLDKKGLLDENAFRIALERITEKLEPPEPVPMVKASRKQTGAPRSRLTLGDNVDIFPDPDKWARMSGAMGVVKRASSAADSEQAEYMIKKPSRETDAYYEAFIEEGSKEVICNKLLGQLAYLYKNHTNKLRFFGIWHSGTALFNLNSTKIRSESYATRIRCIVSALAQLNILHLHYFVHGDLHTRNLIVDFKKAHMKLIDFGLSHKWNRGSPVCEGMSEDVYGMGVVCAILFPELYSTELQPELVTQIKTADLTPVEQAVINLINALLHPDLKVRCTSEDALNYCNELIKKMDTLNHEEVKDMASATISKTTTTVEDVLRKVM